MKRAKKKDEDHFRSGIQRMTRNRSVTPSMEDCAGERYIKNARRNGPLPYTQWESIADTATTPYGKEVAGDYPLPKTKRERDVQMGELRGGMRLLLLW